MSRTARAAALLFVLALLPIAHAAAQPVAAWRGLPWGLPADSVGPRLAAMGMAEAGRAGDGTVMYAEAPGVSVAPLAGARGVVAVQVYRQTDSTALAARFAALADSLRGVLGAPAERGTNRLVWRRGRSEVVVEAKPRRRDVPSILAVSFRGPGYDDEMARRGAFRGRFPALEPAWTIVRVSDDRRVAFDTASVEPRGASVVRARFRTDYARVQTLMDVGTVDALEYHADFDCALGRWRSAQASYLRQGRAVGSLAVPAPWTAAQGEPLARAQLEMVCAAAPPPAAAGAQAAEAAAAP
jgi:hypothetical protein